jgi:hypothetical protein
VVLLARLILGAGIGVVVHAIPIRIADEIAAAALVGEMLPADRPHRPRKLS